MQQLSGFSFLHRLSGRKSYNREHAEVIVSGDTPPRALPVSIESILFLDWRGDPLLNRAQRDVYASGKTGLAPGGRQSETLKGWALLRQIRRNGARP